MNYPKFKVCVRCFTFNQADYIEDAMNGFTMQQTDFPFVCCIVDDASTDKEQKVIKSYMDRNFNLSDSSVSYKKETDYANIIYAQHNSNKNCFFAVLFLKENLYSKNENLKKIEYISEWSQSCEYEAICEGDDYWTVCDKLQKQVCFMDDNQDYSFCHTGFDIYIQNFKKLQSGIGIVKNNLSIISEKDNLAEWILDGNSYRIQTATVLLRNKYSHLVAELLRPYRGKFLMGDTQMWLAYLSFGRIGFLPEVTTVYRVNNGSACRPDNFEHQIRFDLSCAEMRVEMADLFNLNEKFKRYLQKQYHNKLNLYYCYNENYKPFVKIKFNNAVDMIQYHLLKFSIMRVLLRKIYEYRMLQYERKNEK